MAFFLLEQIFQGAKLTKDKISSLKMVVRKKIGPIAIPDVIQEAPGLPKTRSGKLILI